MATSVEFKRVVRDEAGLEDAAEIGIGTTGFRGDGNRLFVQWNGTGVLFSHEDANALIDAVERARTTLEAR